jgi:deoxycytidylate deaminase
MKRLFARIPFLLGALLLMFPLSKLPGRSGTPNNTFTGEVTDTICARSGSHNEMMAKMSTMGHDKETCTKKCTQIGAKYVLYVEANQRFYKFDDQAKAEAFAGKKVRVSGTLEGDAIRVTKVEAVG